MPKYLSMPDGSSLKLKEDETAQEGLKRSIDKYPEIFFVDNFWKCGTEPYYASIPLPQGGYACGYTAYNEANAKTYTHTAEIASKENKILGLNMENNTLITAVIPSVIAAAIGFGVAHYLTKGLKNSYRSKVQTALILLLMISIGTGLAGVLNELINFPLNGLKIRFDKIIQLTVTNLAFLPLVLWGIIRLLGKEAGAKSDHQGATSENPSAAENVLTQPTTAPEPAQASILKNTEAVGTSLFKNRQNSQEANINPEIHSPSDEEINLLYAAAMDEIESNKKDKGVWAKSFSLSGGDIKKAEAKYIEERFAVLKTKAIADSKASYYAEAQKLTAEKALRGDIDAIFEFTKANYSGQKQLDEAFKLVRDAAYLGGSKAQHSLSSLYWRGEGTIRNKAYAHAWAVIASPMVSDALNNISFFEERMNMEDFHRSDELVLELRKTLSELPTNETDGATKK